MRAPASACEGHALVDATPREGPAPDDPIRCDELGSPPLVPQPTQATCRALPSAARAPCLERVRARSRTSATLAQARSAVARRDWVAAIDAFEAALVALPGQPDVLAELGWARFQAASWCQRTPDGADRDDVRDEEDPDLALAQLTVRCAERFAVARALEELSAAVSAAPSVEEWALWQSWSARVALGIGRERDAFESARQSLCAHENAATRELVGELLWRAGHRAGPDAPEQAIALYRQSMLVHPTPVQQDYVANVSDEFGAPFAIDSPSPAESAQFYPDIDGLCDALVGRDLTEPASPEELPGELCETSAWEDVHVARGEELAMQFRVAVVRAESPERYDGSSASHYLVAQSTRGLSVLLHLGREHGESRQCLAYVSSIDTETDPLSPDAPLVVSWEVGEAYAAGCDWNTAATRYVTFCALVGGVPRCFAGANLGAAEFASDEMLATVDESLGRCDDFVESPRERPFTAFRPRYDVTITPEELVATRLRDGAMLCLPLHETLAPLSERMANPE